MGKQRNKSHESKDVIENEKTTLSVLRQELDLWYRLQVFVYDLSNVGNDPASEKRISSITNELYISEPYFTDAEAGRIRTALIDSALEHTDESRDEALNVADEAEDVATRVLPEPDSTPTFNENVTVEEAIHARLSKFFEKRKASGDARPCGPHDMLPIYLSVFGIDKDALKDDRFLRRLRRSGLGNFRSGEGTPAEHQPAKSGKGKKKDKKVG